MPKKNNPGEVRRFYTEVVLTHDGDDCLIWPYCKSVLGYALISHKGKTRLVPRLVCEHTYGPPPTPEHEAAHSCGHESCVNPHHLRWATSKENSADRMSHGTWGIQISEETAREMLRLKGLLSVNEISERFAVRPTLVYGLFEGRTWKHLHTE